MTDAGEPLVVRTAQISDAPSIAAIGSVAFRAVHDDVIGSEFATTVVEQTYSVEALTDCITRCANAGDAEFLVAERDGGLVGYLHYDSEGAEPELHRIYVDPGQKRGGVGSALMRELHARLPPDGEYILLVVEANNDARAFDAGARRGLRGHDPEVGRSGRDRVERCRNLPTAGRLVQRF